MKRIFADYAYGAGPRDGCWWDETAHVPVCPKLEGEVVCDVAIVGGGFTGLSAALHLARGGASVVLLEAHALGWGASGRNGGFCCLGGGMASDSALDRRFGKVARLAWRQCEKAAVDLVDRLISELNLDVDRHSNGETCLAHTPRAARSLETEGARTLENYGVRPEIIAADDLAAHGMSGPFHGAFTNPIGFGLNPRKYLAGLATAATTLGVRIYGQSQTTRVEPTRVITPSGTVQAERIIVATNGYSSEDIPSAMAGLYMPAQSTIIVTRPLRAAELQSQGWLTDQMAYDTRHLLHYFRLMPDQRFLFGMRGGLAASVSAEQNARSAVMRDFRHMFPAWSDVDITHSWSGLVCLARNLLPYVGRLPGMPHVLAGFAYHGNGVAMGTLTGRFLADMVLENSPVDCPDVIRHPARAFPFGTKRRVVMPPIYAAFQARDWIR
ncbi:FAD-dependent oxidoreductase [uncultured Tateyamaria sp.]|uniref:NAD(P)/FAD-dependent oxidoreductase n=1 Tax=uncultured Tateyamaria sp. TaxID=455651 RepID=UPI0026175CD6|nr:FAD-dependent oxidoreductase [uncultured Tateyamaria sp.]